MHVILYSDHHNPHTVLPAKRHSVTVSLTLSMTGCTCPWATTAARRLLWCPRVTSVVPAANWRLIPLIRPRALCLARARHSTLSWRWCGAVPVLCACVWILLDLGVCAMCIVVFGWPCVMRPKLLNQCGPTRGSVVDACWLVWLSCSLAVLCGRGVSCQASHCCADLLRRSSLVVLPLSWACRSRWRRQRTTFLASS